MPAYLLRPGRTPGVALYTCCEDELLCRAELLALLEKASRNSPQDQQVSGHYDVDPTFTIARFKRGYRGRAGDYQRLMALRAKIIAEGWPFPDLPRSENPEAVVVQGKCQGLVFRDYVSDGDYTRSGAVAEK